MLVNNQFFQPKNTFINSARVNASISKQNMYINGSKNKSNNDRVVFSSQGKMMNIIENLTKQKENIIENKNKLVNKTIANGGDIDTIKGQLEIYTKQIEDIDKQISNIYTQQAKEAIKNSKQKNSNESNKNKSEEQLESDHLMQLANVSNTLKHAEKVSSVQTKVEGEVRTKESEVKIGEVRIDVLESKGLNGTNVEDLIVTEKQSLNEIRKNISDLQEKASQLGIEHGNKVSNLIKDLKNSTTPSYDGDKTKPSKQEEYMYIKDKYANATYDYSSDLAEKHINNV